MNIEQVLMRFREVLGEVNVLDAPLALTKYGSNTNGIIRTLLGSVYVDSVTQIQEVVKIANEEHVALYPISTGHNWGYGTSLPVEDNNIILDLSRMNTIIDFDEHLGTVTLQPGVTQKILYDFLTQHNYEYFVPVTGAGPKASIIGNALERGFGITPFSDHFHAITTVSAVLPDGSLYRSPLEEAGCVRVDRLYKYGIGAYLDGIFTQSNFGIVTEMTIALARKPKAIKMFSFSVDSGADLQKIITLLPSLLHTLGSINTGIKFVNKTQVQAMIEGGNTKDTTSSSKFIPTWTVSGGLFGDKRMVKVAEKILKEDLSRYTSKIFVVDARFFHKYHHVLAYLPFYSKIKSQIETAARVIDLFIGIPSVAALPLAYTKSGTLPKDRNDADPGKDGCGLIWFAPLIPIDARIVSEYLHMAQKVLEKHGLPPMITFTTVNDRCFDSPLPIVYDKNNEQSLLAAKACYDELWKESQKLGLMPYRIPVDEMHRLTSNDTPFFRMLETIKNALDPKHIIAPGRYGKSSLSRANKDTV